MSSQTFRAQTPSANDEAAIRDLYQKLLDGWNRRSASDYAVLFAEDGYAVGFDGSQHDGRAQIEAELGKIFADHQTSTVSWQTGAGTETYRRIAAVAVTAK